MPIILQPAPTLSVVKTESGIALLWPTNAGRFTIQSTPAVQPAAWTDLNPQPSVTIMGTNYEAELTATNASRFYRLAR
jgi:hypothetical protein